MHLPVLYIAEGADYPAEGLLYGTDCTVQNVYCMYVQYEYI
jgi:hypothetical protein